MCASAQERYRPRVLWVGLTGGIGAGKSAVSRELTRLGAALVDADVIAREVVQPGSDGLAQVVEAFGDAVLRSDGGLDREALGTVVFADDEARVRLNGIVHPLIGARTGELARRAEATGAPVLVHDVPLLVENGLAPAYHLVVVVEAPLGQRLHRLTALRGMPEVDARARIAAQADDVQRAAVADVVLSNDGSLETLAERVAGVWHERVLPFADNLRAGRPAAATPVERSPQDWAAQARRVADRLQFVAGPRAAAVDHVGTTAVPELDLPGVLEVQIEVGSNDDAADLCPALSGAGFPATDHAAANDLAAHGGADPGRPVVVHVRDATAAQQVRATRDVLRTDPDARARYADRHRRALDVHGDDLPALRAALDALVAAKDSEQ